MTEDWLKIINYHGIDEQIKHWFTEVYELVQAIERDDGTIESKNKIMSELADNFNFLKQIQVFYQIDNKDLELEQLYKNQRTLDEMRRKGGC